MRVATARRYLKAKILLHSGVYSKQHPIRADRSRRVRDTKSTAMCLPLQRADLMLFEQNDEWQTSSRYIMAKAFAEIDK